MAVRGAINRNLLDELLEMLTDTVSCKTLRYTSPLKSEGEHHDYLPARFGTSGDSLLAQLECPERHGPKQPTVVYCGVSVRTDGSVQSYRRGDHSGLCFETRFIRTARGRITYANQRYVDVTEKALIKAKLIPAEIDGIAVPTNFSFQVVFEDRDGCVTTAFPNQGYKTADLGRSYVAPQEIATDGGWRHRAQLPYNVLARGSIGGLYSISVLVDENGNASDGQVEFAADVITSDDTKSAIAALEQSKFIPGFYQGKPHAMRYLDLVLNRPLE